MLNKEVQQQLKVIRRRCEEIIPEEDLEKKLKYSLENNKPLKVKFGIDPTGSDLHLGHAVPLRKLREFQMLGHKIDFIVGNFTAKIGDPTGKNELRKMLSDSEIEKNFENYLDQASSILDISSIHVQYNSDWLNKLSLEDLLKILSHFSLAIMISREDFANRIKNNLPISLVELLYPVMQAYDSVHLESDIEIGGTEQKFNLLRGRDLQKAFNKAPQVCLTMPILEGLNGQKMSKSFNNYISIKESANEMYGKTMSINDNLINQYFNLATLLSSEAIQQEEAKGPYLAKKALAFTLTELYHNRVEAEKAEEYFSSLFSKKEVPEEIEELRVNNMTLLDTICSIMNVSKSEARRLLASNAVKHNTIVLNDENIILKEGILKIGKKRIFKLI